MIRLTQTIFSYDDNNIHDGHDDSDIADNGSIQMGNCAVVLSFLLFVFLLQFSNISYFSEVYLHY